MATSADTYPPAYDKAANNKKLRNVPDSWITRWPDRYVRELETSTTKARSKGSENEEK